jgi:ribosome-binding protein aMBF1 (putative translation factor)
MCKNNIKEWIDKRGMKNKFLADEIGCHRTDISQWIAGRRKPNRDRLRLLARLLKCNMSDLYESGKFKTTYTITEKE